MNEPVFVGLGSNLGLRAVNLERAIRALRQVSGIHVVAVAPPYENEALLAPGDLSPQPFFLNTVVELRTSLRPRQVLEACLAIEATLGRVRGKTWASRIIDLDVLFFGRQVIEEDGLRVPHPRLHERKFALQPLCRLAPDFVHPVLGRRLDELLQQLA